MVRVNVRGEINHTEQSHYFLKNLLETVYHHMYSIPEYITSQTSNSGNTNTSVPTISTVSGSIPVHLFLFLQIYFILISFMAQTIIDLFFMVPKLRPE